MKSLWPHSWIDTSNQQTQMQLQVNMQQVEQKQDLYLLSKSMANVMCSIEAGLLKESSNFSSQRGWFSDFDYVGFAENKTIDEIIEQAEAQLFVFNLSVKGFKRTWNENFSFPMDFTVVDFETFIEIHYMRASQKLKKIMRDMVELLHPEFLTKLVKLQQINQPRSYLENEFECKLENSSTSTPKEIEQYKRYISGIHHNTSKKYIIIGNLLPKGLSYGRVLKWFVTNFMTVDDHRRDNESEENSNHDFCQVDCPEANIYIQSDLKNCNIKVKNEEKKSETDGNQYDFLLSRESYCDMFNQSIL